MMEKIPFRLRIGLLLVLAVLGSLWLGFSIERVFVNGFELDWATGLRFVPLLLAFLLVSSFFTVLSLTAGVAWRGGGVVITALAFGLPFIISPNPIGIPLGFSLLVALTYAGAILFLDYLAKRAVKTRALFEAAMFTPAYGRFFQLLVFAIGILVYFSSQLSVPTRFTVPEEVLSPALNLVINQVINQVQNQLGNEQFTEQQFLTELEKSGVLKILEQQYGIVLDPQDVTTPKQLAESLRQPLTEELSRSLEGMIEPYLPFLPLAAALGVALSLLFLTPVFAWLAVGAFALIYRILVWLKFARFEPETREVPVLKIG